jgi:hypothetical protein
VAGAEDRHHNLVLLVHATEFLQGETNACRRAPSKSSTIGEVHAMAS